MRNFLFYDNEEGINFIVQANTIGEAIVVAHEEFPNPEFIEELTEEEAEMLGYDTF